MSSSSSLVGSGGAGGVAAASSASFFLPASARRFRAFTRKNTELGFAPQTGQNDLQFGEVDAAQENGNDGHDDIVGETLGDGGESGANDGTNSKSHGVALDGEGFKLVPPGGLFDLVAHM